MRRKREYVGCEMASPIYQEIAKKTRNGWTIEEVEGKIVLKKPVKNANKKSLRN